MIGSVDAMSRAGIVLGVLATSIFAGTLGLLAGRALAQDEPKTPLPPTPSDVLLQPITAPSQVRPFQTLVAEAIQKRPEEMWGLGPIDYSSSDVDGDPNNPKWRRVLAFWQKKVNNLLAEYVPPEAPSGFPKQLRTDGVLDYATSIAIYHPLRRPWRRAAFLG